MPATLSLVVAGAALVALPAAGAVRDGSAAVRPAISAGTGPVALGLADSVDAAAEPAAAQSDADAVTERFAVVDDVDLHLPGAQTVAHGFHEAGGSAPLSLSPVGTLTATEDLNGFDPTSVVASEGPEFVVLPSRGRGQGPTTAADIVMRPGEPVLAPVDGTVTTVADYALYGRTNDTLIYIEPTDQPHLQVAVLHVDGATVSEGDQVRAGETVVADTARQLPFPSQIDRFVGDSLPHVHLEVTRTDVAA